MADPEKDPVVLADGSDDHPMVAPSFLQSGQEWLWKAEAEARQP